MDLSKAFDCLPHGLLIEKLRACGLASDAIDLLSSYLSDACSRLDWDLTQAHGEIS